MITINQTDRVVILGDSGSGKTVLASKIIESIPQQRLAVITPYQDEMLTVQNRLVTASTQKALGMISAVLKKGNTFLVIDDFDVYFDDSITQKEGPLKFLMISSRHVGVGWLAISRRTADIPKMVVKQALKIIIFQTDLPHDLGFIEDMFGSKAAETVANLDRSKHEAWLFDRITREQKVIVV